MIDFGFAETFQDKNGRHKPQESDVEFKGNIIFSSLSKLEFKSCGRKDDLISLCLMISFLLNDGKLPNIEDADDLSLNQVYLLNREVKSENTVQDYCVGKAEPLTRFFEEIFKLEYAEVPNYNYLRGILLEVGMQCQ